MTGQGRRERRGLLTAYVAFGVFWGAWSAVLPDVRLVAGSFLLEDAVSSWSALHLERTLGAAPWQSGLGPGLFAGAMAAGRFGVHLVARAGQEARTVVAGGLVLALGLLLFALAPAPAVALVGTGVAGAGVSVLAPTLYAAVGARSVPGRQGADLALVTAAGYAGFVTGPVVVGLLSGATSLPTALALLALPAVAVAVAGGALLRRPVRAFAPAAAGQRMRDGSDEEELTWQA